MLILYPRLVDDEDGAHNVQKVGSGSLLWKGTINLGLFRLSLFNKRILVYPCSINYLLHITTDQVLLPKKYEEK